MNPMAMVGLEELGQLKKLMTSPGIEPVTFQLVTVPAPKRSLGNCPFRYNWKHNLTGNTLKSVLKVTEPRMR
jgi:hypothetical protein